MVKKRQKVDLLIPDGAEKIKTPAGEFVKEILFPLKEKAVIDLLNNTEEVKAKEDELKKRESRIARLILGIESNDEKTKEIAFKKDGVRLDDEGLTHIQRCFKDRNITQRELFIIRARIVEKWQKENAAAILRKYPRGAVVDTLKFAISRYAAMEQYEIESAIEIVNHKNKSMYGPYILIYRHLNHEDQRDRIQKHCIAPGIGIRLFLKELHTIDKAAWMEVFTWIDDTAAQISKAIPKGIREKAITEVEKAFRKKRQESAEIIEAEPIEEELPYDVYGTGSTLQNTAIAINYVDNPGRLAEVEKSIDRHPVIEVRTDKNQLAIRTTTREREALIQFEDVAKMVKENNGASKLLHYLLARLNEQAYSPEKGLKANEITFSLDAAHSVFKYASKQTTSKMIERAADALTGLKIKGTVTDRKGEKTTTSKAIAVLFPYFEKKRGVFTFKINPWINWGMILNYFTVMPKYSYALPPKAFKLAVAVSERARQSVDEINKNGFFTISNRTLQKWLNLPLEEETKNPARDIVEAIEKAVTDIENTDKGQLYKFEHGGCSESTGIKDFLTDGYLKIYPQGKILEYFKKLHDCKTKKIEARQKRTASRKKKPIGGKKPEQNTIIENINSNDNP